MSMVKLFCNVDEKLMQEVEEYAKSLHITKTAAVSVLLSRALQGDKLAASINDMMEAYRQETAPK